MHLVIRSTPTVEYDTVETFTGARQQIFISEQRSATLVGVGADETAAHEIIEKDFKQVCGPRPDNTRQAFDPETVKYHTVPIGNTLVPIVDLVGEGDV